MSKDFGEKIEKLVKKLGIKKQDLANDIGVSPSALTKYLTGEREPSFEILSNMATALETTTDYLLGISKSDKDPKNECIQTFTRNEKLLSNDDKLKLASIILKNIKK